MYSYTKLKYSLVIICFIILSCEQKTNNKIGSVEKPTWTDKQIKTYFADSIAYRMYNGRFLEQKDSLNDFEVFSRTILHNIKAKNIDDPLIIALDEPYIDTTKIDSLKSWIRFSVNPCFRRPYCLIVEKKYNKTFITSKVSDGNGGYFTGLLLFSITNILSDSVYNNISMELKDLNFWGLGQDTTCPGGADGETWKIEAIENGNYKIIERWVPFDCGNEITKHIAQIGKEIRDSSYMFEGFKIKYKDINDKERFDDAYGR